jgi:hypothetical protein
MVSINKYLLRSLLILTLLAAPLTVVAVSCPKGIYDVVIEPNISAQDTRFWTHYLDSIRSNNLENIVRLANINLLEPGVFRLAKNSTHYRILEHHLGYSFQPGQFHVPHPRHTLAVTYSRWWQDLLINLNFSVHFPEQLSPHHLARLITALVDMNEIPVEKWIRDSTQLGSLKKGSRLHYLFCESGLTDLARIAWFRCP